jgi:ATP-dependent helicase/nuclease subunit A
MSEPPAPVRPDEPERRRIRTELGRSLLVEAGAGSGKTHELAARMAAGIATGAYRIEQMAAVTFTRKAAAELRGRFQLALEEEARAVTGDATLRIHHALANIERFFAGTIHAFCARLLRERPVEAGVAPGFTELDDAENNLLRVQSWRDYRSQAAADGDVDFQLLDDADVKSKLLDDAFRTICLYEEVEFPAGAVVMPDDAAAWEALEAFWAELSGHLTGPIDPATTCQTQQAMDRFRRDWEFYQRRGQLGGARAPAVLASLIGQWDFTPRVVQ